MFTTEQVWHLSTFSILSMLKLNLYCCKTHTFSFIYTIQRYWYSTQKSKLITKWTVDLWNGLDKEWRGTTLERSTRLQMYKHFRKYVDRGKCFVCIGMIIGMSIIHLFIHFLTVYVVRGFKYIWAFLYETEIFAL